MIIKNRKFEEKEDKNGNVFYVFCREDCREGCDYNKDDIAACAALSMHKAIIGICGLQQMETLTKKYNCNLRQSKAVQTYYVIYHLFTSCMLMDNDYRIIFKKDYNGEIQYGSSIEELKKVPASGEDWNNRKFSEEDLATRIAHVDIKKYCGQSDNPPWYSLRGRACKNKLPAFLKILYDSFVNEKSACILYEKAAYIRDRTIYRPSRVASETENPIQTSKNVREQIDCLPNVNQLYEITKKIHVSICSQCTGIKDEIDIFSSYILNFVQGMVKCTPDYAEKLGYDLYELEFNRDSIDKNSVPSFFAQLMELYSEEESLEYYNRFWKNLISDTRTYLSKH